MPLRQTGIRTMARVGLLARGAVYILMGGLALMVAVQQPGGATTDSRGVLRELIRQPHGYLPLLLIAAGLLCYSIWRLLDGFFDYDRYGRSAKGLLIRSGLIGGAVVHLALGAYAVNLVFLFTRTTMRASEQRLVKWLFEWPYGDWLVGAVGLGILIFGASQFVIAWREAFRHYMVIPAKRARLLLPICKYGLMARGLIFVLIGHFFLRSAFKHSVREAGGFKEAWKALRAQPHGEVWVALVAVGFIAYGFFSATEAAYRKKT